MTIRGKFARKIPGGFQVHSGIIIILVFHIYSTVGQVSTDQLEDNKRLGSLCAGIDKINYVSKMEELITLIKKSLSRAENMEKLACSQQLGCFLSYKFWDHKLYSVSERNCVEQAEAILSLEPLIREKNNVCSGEHINRIREYYDKFVRSPTPISHPLITERFFNVYVSQVAMVCKRGILYSLHEAEKQFVSKDDYEKVMPWISYAAGCDSKASDPAEEPGAEPSYNLNSIWWEHCNAIQALGRITTLVELVGAIETDESIDEDLGLQVEADSMANELKQIDDPGSSSATQFLLLLPEELRPSVVGMVEACHHLEPIYENTVLPIVRLAQMGFNPRFDHFDKKCREEELIHRWFTITLVCNSMRDSRLPNIRQSYDLEVLSSYDSTEPTESLIVVENGDDHDTELDKSAKQSDQQLSELSKVPEFLSYPMEDKLWVSKYLPTKFGTIKSNLFKSILKTFHLDDPNKMIVFKGKVRKTRSVVFKTFILAISIQCISS